MSALRAGVSTLALAMLVCAVPGSAADDQITITSSARASYETGRRYSIGGHTREAIRYLSNAIDECPNWADPYVERGIAYDQSGEYREAVGDYTKALALNPKHFDAFYNRAHAWLKLHEYEKAIADYKNAGQLYPRGLRDVEISLGNVYDEMGDRQIAVEHYTSALKISTDAETLRRRALDFAVMNRVPDAEQDLKTAIKLNPSSNSLKRAEVFLTLARGDNQTAIKLSRAELLGQDWRSADAPYMVLIGCIGYSAVQHDAYAKQLLTTALASCAKTWPYPILQYLRGDLTEAAMLEKAKNVSEQTEARTYAALNELRKGQTAQAHENLAWVRSHGNADSIEFAMAPDLESKAPSALAHESHPLLSSTLPKATSVITYGGNRQQIPVGSGGTSFNAAIAGSPAKSADTFFITQIFDPKWNFDGPRSSKNCGPASLAMVFRYFDKYPPGAHPDDPEQLIESARLVMTGNDDIQGLTNFSNVIRGASAVGLNTAIVRNQRGMDEALKNGAVVVASGCPNMPGSYGPRLNYKSGYYGHFILICSFDGINYTINDPLSVGGPITVNPGELAAFLSYWPHISLKGGIAISD